MAICVASDFCSMQFRSLWQELLAADELVDKFLCLMDRWLWKDKMHVLVWIELLRASLQYKGRINCIHPFEPRKSMAVEFAEALLLWNKSVTDLGMEFKLPDISSPWLTKVFQIEIGKFDCAEFLHPADDFETEQGSRVPPMELVNFGPAVEIVEKEVAPIPVPDTSLSQRRLQSLSDQQGFNSLAFDGSLLDDASSDTEGGSWYGTRIATEWHMGDYRVGLVEEGFGEQQISD